MSTGPGEDSTDGPRPDDSERSALSGHTHLPGHVRRVPPQVATAATAHPRHRPSGPSRAEIERAAADQRRRRRRWWALGTVLVLLAVAVIGVTLLRGPLARELPWADPQGANPFEDGTFYVWPDSQASAAADAAEQSGRTTDAARLERISEVPTAVWLTPEALPRGQVGTFARDIAVTAAEAGQVAVFVVYGVTDRDCTGVESAGGLPPDEYAAWVGEIAAALGAADTAAIAIVEPDGLSATFECGNTEERVGLLAGAIGSLVDADVPTYVDAGHSDWRGVDEMAALLRDVGVDRVRGFSTNVAGYQSDEDERAYADDLSAALDGAHYVVDTGRNGAPSTSEWCNPPARLLGDESAVVDDGSAQDARFWIKPPGESDGQCNGGPQAGSFWPERALAMASASGW